MNSHPPRQPKKRRGFTLLELLVVITIIGILASLAFGAFNAVMRQTRKTQARAGANDLQLAIKSYYAEYNRYPIRDHGSDAEMESDDTLMSILMGVDRQLNPRGITFWQGKEATGKPPKAGIDLNGDTGTLLDPWGEPYMVKIDGDYNKELENPDTEAENPKVFQGVIVWSKGPDRDQEKTAGGFWKDNVTTWN